MSSFEEFTNVQFAERLDVFCYRFLHGSGSRRDVPVSSTERLRNDLVRDAERMIFGDDRSDDEDGKGDPVLA